MFARRYLHLQLSPQEALADVTRRLDEANNKLNRLKDPHQPENVLHDFTHDEGDRVCLPPKKNHHKFSSI